MSQAIRKYQTGGKSPKEPELFEWKDVNKYNKADVISGLYKNVDTYIQHNGLKGEQANQFRSATNQFIEGLKNGTITMNGDGTFTDASGTMSSTGKFDKRFFGGTKNTENNAFNRVGDYAKGFIKGMNPYKAPVQEEQPVTKKAAMPFQQRLANIAMGGNWDDNLWRKFNTQDRLNFLKQAIQSSHDEFINDPEAEFNKDVFGTRDNWISRSSGLLNALADDKYDPEDLKFSAAMGYGDLSRYLNDEVVDSSGHPVSSNPMDNLKAQLAEKAKAQGLISDEAINAYVTNGLRQHAANEQSFIEANEKASRREATQRYFDELRKAKPFKSDVYGIYTRTKPYADAVDKLSSYFKETGASIDKYLSATLSRSAFRPDRDAGQNIVNNFAYLNTIYPDQLVDVGEGYKAIPTTYDYDNYTAYAFNPDTNEYKEVSMLDNDKLKELAFTHYESKQPKVAKHQQGGIFDRAANDRYYETRRQARQDQIAQKAFETGRSAEQVEGDSTPHTQWSKADITRMGALMGDVASLVASMTGVGSVASATIGAASTAANQAADMMEGQDFGQSLWNNAGSYALDALSLIPFAKAAKVPRMIKTAGRFAPMMMTALSAYQGLQNYDEYVKSWGKVTKGESLSVTDWRNLLNSAQLVVGGTAAVHRASKAKSHVAAANTGDEWVKTNQGYRRVAADKMKAIRNAKTLEAQNKILEGTDIVLPEAKSWTGKGKGVAKIPEADKANMVYDFSKPVTTYSGDLPLQHKFGPGEKFFGTAQFPNINLKFPNVRNAYNKVVHPKAFKRAQTAKAEEVAKANKPITEGVDAISNMLNSMVRASRYQSGATPRKRVNAGVQQYASRAVPLGGAPVQAPDAATVRTVMGINNAVNAVPTKKSLPAVIPASRNAEKVVAANTKKPTMGTKELIESKLPKGELKGAARTKKEKFYKDTFEPVIEKEQNALWDQLIAQNPGFGYTDVTPRRNVYTPKQGTEITYTAPTNETSTMKAPIKMFEEVHSQTRRAMQRKEASRNNTLPHKKSNKTKKTSRDDRVTKKADGGIIPMLQTGNVMKKRNVSSASDLNWSTDIAGSQGFKNTLGGINTSNARLYNDMQNTYATLGFNDTKPGDVSLSYNPKVADYQGRFDNMTTINDDTMSGLVKSGRIAGRGGSSDKGTQWTPDGYAGDQTWLRHLGKKGSDLAAMNETLNPNGLEATINYKNGMVNYMPILKQAGIPGLTNTEALPTKLESPVPAMGSNPTKKQIRDANKAQKKAQEGVGDGTIRGASKDGKKGLGGFNVLPEDVIALGRMVGGLATNNKAARQYKAGLKPLLIDTYENTVPVTGNYFAKASADKQASDLTSLAARPRTSDASLQLAGELEANNRAGMMRFQGDMMDAQEFQRTRALAQGESDAAKARRVDVANRNRASMLQIDAAKAQIDSAKTTANYQQVINPYMAGIENQFRQNRAAKKQYEAESYRQGLMAQIQPQYDAAVKAGDVAKQQELLRKYNTDMLNYSKDNVGMPWMFQRKTRLPDSGPNYTYAKGGKLSTQDKLIIQRAKDFNKRMLADNKQFHKDIMAAKKQHADLIRSMSSLTAELIKRGMS